MKNEKIELEFIEHELDKIEEKVHALKVFVKSKIDDEEKT